MNGTSIQDALRSAEELHRAGKLVEAENICRQILEQKPHQTGALSLLSILARQQGQFAAAVDLAAHAARVQPQIAELHANLAEFSRLAGMPQESIASFQRAIELKPLEPTFHNSLAIALAENRQHESAVGEYQRAIELNPDYADARNNLGGVLRELGRLDEAAEAIGSALRLQPRMAGAHINLAIVQTDQERFHDAIESYSRAIAIQPDHRQAHWSLGTLYLRLGDMQRGWPEYQWRPTIGPRFAQPIWNGEDLHGKTILIHAEQGVGDTIQFIRYVPMLAERGAQILLVCQPELTRLLAGLARVLPADQPLPPLDFHCPLLNLPMAFGTDARNIPAAIPYLKAPDELSKRR
jgi:tetratricopeptide (TPR) repeat protein